MISPDLSPPWWDEGDLIADHSMGEHDENPVDACPECREQLGRLEN